MYQTLVKIGRCFERLAESKKVGHRTDAHMYRHKAEKRICQTPTNLNTLLKHTLRAHRHLLELNAGGKV